MQQLDYPPFDISSIIWRVVKRNVNPDPKPLHDIRFERWVS